METRGMKGRWLPFGALVVALGLLIATLAAVHSTPEVKAAGSPSETAASARWPIQCVDCPKSFIDMTDRSLQLDAEGHPHVAYGGDHLYYAWHDGAIWHYETVDDAPGVGAHAALALDGDQNPHISYIARMDNIFYDYSLTYAYRDAAGWHTETVDTELSSYSGHTSLAVDSEGYPHISYYSEFDASLNYAYRDATGWHIESVPAGQEINGHSLALDGQGSPHIAYWQGLIDGELRYTYRDASGWHDRTVDYPSWTDEDLSLALDRYGYPHISYHDDWPGQLKLAYEDASGWHVEIIEDGDYSDYYFDPSLALDRNGYAHVSYYDGANGALKHAYQDPYGWHIETVDGEGGRDGSLALDTWGFPYISYRVGGDLRYAYKDMWSWYVETVENGGQIYGQTSLAVDSDARPHIAYHDTSNVALKYAYRDAAGWHLETVESELRGEGFSYSSLALGESGIAHISYVDHGSLDDWSIPDTLKYAHRDATGWHTETVLSVGNSTYFHSTSLALDGNGYPHISYVCFSWEAECGLVYAYQDITGWYTETVDSQGSQCSSLALDENGYPHISYSTVSPDYHLRYAYLDATGWHTETVGSGGTQNSLALDADGYAHITYSSDGLAYAYQDVGGWHIEIADADPYSNGYSSLALDGAGYPHVSYYDFDRQDLKYAHMDATGWSVERVDTSLGEMSGYNSLALDGDGQPQIGYIDGNGMDLMYAYFFAADWSIYLPLVLRNTP